jgi:hypothetical protein
MGVFLEGVQVDTVATAKGEFATRTYRVSIDDGQVTLLLKDLGGSDVYVMLNALEIISVGPETSGPRVTQASPTSVVSGTVDRIVLTFHEAIQDGTFTLADVVSLTGPSGPLTPTAVNRLSATQYEVVFAPQNTVGNYSLTIGPDITDLAGNRMDQDRDGVKGEIPDDRYTTGFSLVAFLARYDFGTATSPVAAGYTRVIYTTAYTATLGYGWQSGAVFSLDRVLGTDLTRDFNYTTLATFAVAVTSGTYDVTVTLGDASSAHDQMGVFLEGVLVDSVTTAKGEFITRTYRISVSDGQVTLLLDDLGGSDPYVMINALEVVSVSLISGGSSAPGAGSTGENPAASYFSPNPRPEFAPLLFPPSPEGDGRGKDAGIGPNGLMFAGRMTNPSAGGRMNLSFPDSTRPHRTARRLAEFIDAAFAEWAQEPRVPSGATANLSEFQEGFDSWLDGTDEEWRVDVPWGLQGPTVNYW